MASLVALGATYTDLILNAIYRGVVSTPPSTLYFSLGQSGSTTVPVEITTTRTAVKVVRGWVSGLDSPTYPYQSSGTMAAGVWRTNVMHEGFDVYCTGMGTNAYLNPCLMAYDAASAGNLLFAIEPSWADVVQLVNNDIVRVGSALYDTLGSGPYDLSLPAGGASYATLVSRAGNPGRNMGAYMYALLTDWLFRGFNSMNDLFDPTTYPNVYMVFVDKNTETEVTAIPRMAIPRSTAAWGAPAYVNAGVNLERKIANLVDFSFPVATGSGSYSTTSVQLRMSNIVQPFDDLIYEIYPMGAVSFSAGDTIYFPAGSLNLVLN